MINKYVKDWKKEAEFLWSLLDDISTLGDIHKPEKTAYVMNVNNLARERSKVFYSDGYKLYENKD